MSKVLILADLHLPFTIEGYLKFAKKQYRKYKCTQVVIIGDEIDFHAISDWESEYDAYSPLQENVEAQKALKPYVKAFPKAKVVWANHTHGRLIKKVQKLGFSFEESVAIYKKKFGVESWDYKHEHTIDGVLYLHGSGSSSNLTSIPAMKIALNKRMPVVSGHLHSIAGVRYSNNGYDTIWGMNVGSALDDKAYAARYGKDTLMKSVPGIGIVTDGIEAQFIPMVQL